MRLGPPFEIVIAPAAGPRTKPKALNAALPFARGTFVAVYDAEDRPEPDQLRLALEAFVAGDERLACVQARLTIDNTADSWLTRLFTAEYAGLFDVFLPGLAGMAAAAAARRLVEPFPRGGAARIGAWDPYNVTEDADLGMRLARFGYRTAVIPSTTYEEAPARFGPWLRQRTRWFKGWMQTWLVHMRVAAPAVARTRAGRASRCSSFWSAAPCWPRWCIRCSRAFDAANSRPRRRPSGAATLALSLHAATLLAGYLDLGRARH